MAVGQYTESLTLKEMKCTIPEYVITFDDDINIIIVVECKNTVKKHCSASMDRPSMFAVDGVLYYAKFLKEGYHVIAIAVSGTTTQNMKVDTFYWMRGQENYTTLEKARDIILEPQNYIELIKGNKLRKAYSLDGIRDIAIDMHNSLREIKVTEAHKPIFIAGVLIALNNEDFLKSYSMLTSYKSVMQNIQNAIENIRKNGLYGVEFDDGLYTLAVANMIIRKDGKSNIYKGDCFRKDITEELKSKNINVGLMNPPYSQKDVVELEFVEHLLDVLAVGGTGVAVVPMSCAIGTKFKDVRERLMKKNTLKAVFSMPDDIFYPTGTNVCVMVWVTHVPHDSTQETFFGYCKNDGFVKRKCWGSILSSGAILGMAENGRLKK